MKDMLFSNDCQFLLWEDKKIKVGQSLLLIPDGKLNNFGDMHKYQIEDDLTKRHFVVLFGMNVFIQNNNEYKRLMRRLNTLSKIIDKYDTSVVYCIADYTDPDNWIARRLNSDGILLESNLKCRNGIIS